MTKTIQEISLFFDQRGDPTQMDKKIYTLRINELESVIMKNISVNKNQKLKFQAKFLYFNLQKKQFSKNSQLSQIIDLEKRDQSFHFLNQLLLLICLPRNDKIAIFVEIFIKVQDIFDCTLQTNKIGWSIIDQKCLENNKDLQLYDINPKMLLFREFTKENFKTNDSILKIECQEISSKNRNFYSSNLQSLTPYIFVREIIEKDKFFQGYFFNVQENSFNINYPRSSTIQLENVTVELSQDNEKEILDKFLQLQNYNQSQVNIERRELYVSQIQQEILQQIKIELSQTGSKLTPSQEEQKLIERISLEKQDALLYRLIYTLQINNDPSQEIELQICQTLIQNQQALQNNLDSQSDFVSDKTFKINQKFQIKIENDLTENYSLNDNFKQTKFELKLNDVEEQIVKIEKEEEKLFSKDLHDQFQKIDVNQSEQFEEDFTEEEIEIEKSQENFKSLKKSQVKFESNAPKEDTISQQLKDKENQLTNQFKDEMDDMLKTLKFQRQNDKILIQQLMEEIKEMKNNEKNNEDKILTLNKKIDQLSDLREEFNAQKYVYETRVNVTKEENYRERTQIPKIQDDFSLPKEIGDIQIQNFELQVHQIKYEQNINPQQNILFEFKDLMNKMHQSGVVQLYQSEQMKKNNDKIYLLKEEQSNNGVIQFNWKLNPFQMDESMTNQFLMHLYFTKLMMTKGIEFNIRDAENNLRISSVFIPFKLFFRQGKKDQIQQIQFPIYSVDEFTNQKSHQIGEINLILINKTDQNGIHQKDKFILKTNSLKNLEFFKNNSLENKEQIKKRILVPLKQQNDKKVFTNQRFLKDIQSDEEKRKFFRVQRFKNNYMQDLNINDFDVNKYSKLKEIFQNSMSKKSNEILCMANEMIQVPYIFKNTYQSSNFRINIVDENNSNFSNLKLVHDKDQILKEEQILNEFLNFLPEQSFVPQSLDINFNNFELEYQRQGVLFMKFICRASYQKARFTVEFINERNEKVFSSLLSFQTVPNFVDRELVFYEMENNVSSFDIDITKCVNDQRRNGVNQTLFIQSSQDNVSITQKLNNLIEIKILTQPSGNQMKFNLFVYESQDKEILLENIQVIINPMKAIEILPEPGITKNFDLNIPSDCNRVVKIHSSNQFVKFISNTMSLTSTQSNKFVGQYLTLNERQTKTIIRVVDESNNKIINSFIVIAQPKKIMPVRTLQEKISKRDKRFLNLKFFNKKSILSHYQIRSSNPNLISPLDSQFSIEGFKETEIRVVINGENLKDEKSCYIFFTEQQETINDVYMINLDLVEKQVSFENLLILFKLVSHNLFFYFIFFPQICNSF